MLITFIDVIGCENPQCRDFAKIVSGAEGVKSYYCPICCRISSARAVPSNVAEPPERYEQYLRRAIAPGKTN